MDAEQAVNLYPIILEDDCLFSLLKELPKLNSEINELA